MTLIGVSQRMAQSAFGELRDCLAHDWYPFLHAAGLRFAAIPNDPHYAVAYARSLSLEGVILTGGDDYGVFPQRDATEEALLDWAQAEGQAAMGFYCKQIRDVDILCSKGPDVQIVGENLEKFLQSRHGFFGMVIDYEEHFACIEDIVSRCCHTNFTLITMTRDPVEQLKSVVNTYIYWAALAAEGLAKKDDPRGALLEKCGDVPGLTRFLLGRGNMWPVGTILPVLAKRAGKRIITDISDLTPPNDTQTMETIARLFYRTPKAWQGHGQRTRFFSRENRFIRHIPPLTHSAGKYSFTLELCPKTFCAFMGEDLSMAFSYEKEEVCLDAGDFDGQVSFVADANDAARLGIGKEAFLVGVKDLIEANDKEVLRAYCKEISEKIRRAEETCSSLCLTSDSIVSLLLSDSDMRATMRTRVRMLADALLEQQCHFSERWEYSAVFL